MSRDYKGALDRYPLHIHEDDLEVTKEALKIADRLQSGEVSEGLLRAGQEAWLKDECKRSSTLFKAMSQQLIKEVKND